MGGRSFAHFNLYPRNRDRVLDELEGFLEDRVEQDDRIMLVSLDRAVEVVHPFTGDRRESGNSGSLRVRPGTQKVAVGVWDEVSGVEFLIHKRVLVGC